MGGLRPLYEGVVITPEMVEPSDPEMKVLGTFNPAGALHDDDRIYLVLRVMEQTTKKWKGHLPVPHAAQTKDGSYRVEWDWLRKKDDIESIGKHSIVMKEKEEMVRPMNISHFRVMRNKDKDGTKFETISDKPEFFPRMAYEEFGIEDPAITPFSEGVPVGDKSYKYLMTYVACSPLCEVSTALAATNDFKTFDRLPPEHPKPIFTVNIKDVEIFPRKIKNPRSPKEKEYMAIPRPSGPTHYMVPSMFLASSPDLYHWEDHGVLIQGDEKGHVGSSAPPLWIPDEGWLVIYHQHRHRIDGKKEYINTIALLDKDIFVYGEDGRPVYTEDGRLIVKMLKKAEVFMDPHMEIQKEGEIDYVVFASTMILHEDGTVTIYAGATDKATTVHKYKLDDIIDFMKFV